MRYFIKAIGAALLLVAVQLIKNAWTNRKAKKSIASLLTGTIALVVISVIALYASPGRGSVGDIFTGIGGTALIVGACLPHKKLWAKYQASK